MVSRMVSKLLAPISRRVRLLARRAVVRLINDDTMLQEVQLAIFSDEVRDRVERWQDYGFTSHPLPGAEAIVLALGGNTDHGAVIKVDDRRYRLKGLTQGEVAIYDDQGQTVILKRDNVIELQTTGKVRVAAPLFEVTGDITDLCDTIGRSMAGMRAIFNSHTHDENNTSGPTDPPNQEM